MSSSGRAVDAEAASPTEGPVAPEAPEAPEAPVALMHAVRRSLHRRPEVGLHLPHAQTTVLDALVGLPLEITLGRSLTSVVAVLRGGRPGPAVLLRGDMDALAVHEDESLPDRSEVDGCMHACGHDLHTAMLVGAAHLLAAEPGRLAGDVVFMFQPGEEGCDGARLMIDEGVLDAAGERVVAAYALHVLAAAAEPGVFVTRSGTVLSGYDEVHLLVRGRGGHGAQPHLARDPVVAACQMVVSLEAEVTRSIDAFDPVVVSVGRLHAGTQVNAIPDAVEVALSVRSFSPPARRRAAELIERVARGTAAAHGVEVDVELRPVYGPTVNDADEVDRAERVLAATFGTGRVARWANPWPASEDFSRVLDLVPGAFVGLGATPAGLDPAVAANNHSPRATFDASSMADGARALAALAVARLADHEPAADRAGVSLDDPPDAHAG
jgi:amidohydrolase